jgi:hypothetical protein
MQFARCRMKRPDQGKAGIGRGAAGAFPVGAKVMAVLPATRLLVIGLMLPEVMSGSVMSGAAGGGASEGSCDPIEAQAAIQPGSL